MLIQTFKLEPDVDIKVDLNNSDVGAYAIDATVNTKVEEEDNGTSSDDTSDEDQDRPQSSKRKRTVSTAANTSPKKYKTDSSTSLLSKYFNMNCDLCDSQLPSYREANKHYKDVHDLEKGYLICCGKKFYRHQHMLQHCEWHINPESFK